MPHERDLHDLRTECRAQQPSKQAFHDFIPANSRRFFHNPYMTLVQRGVKVPPWQVDIQSRAAFGII